MATVKIAAAVDSAAFVAFFDTFQEYRAAFEGQPEAWKHVGEATKETTQDFAAAAKSVRELADHMDDVLSRTRALDNTTEKTSRSWKDMAKSTKDTAKNILGATTELLKWAGITGLLTGLAGGGGLFGLNSLAGSVSSGRTAALGTGTTYGRRSAFNVNFGARLGDTDSILSNINVATHDVTKQRALATLHVPFKGRDTTDVATDAIVALKKWTDHVPASQLANQMQAQGIDQTFSLSTVEQIKAMSAKEIDDAVRQMKVDAPKMELSNETQLAWTGLKVQLDNAGKQIETTLVKGLVSLTPGIEKLSDATQNIVKELLKEDGPVKQWLDELNHGLEYLAKEVGTKEFKEGTDEFLVKLGETAKWIWEVGKSAFQLLHWLAKLVGASEDVPGPADAASTDPTGDAVKNSLGGNNPGGTGKMTGLRAGRDGAAGGNGSGGGRGGSGSGGGRGSAGRAGGSGGEDLPQPTGPLPAGKIDNTSSEKNLTSLITKASKEAGIDPSIMEGIRAGESNRGNRFDVGDGGDSGGPFQLDVAGGRLGAQFQRETGFNPLDKRTIPAQARWVARLIAKRLKKNPHYDPGSEWFGYMRRNKDGSWTNIHGQRRNQGDPEHWGDAGYQPNAKEPEPDKPKDVAPKQTMPASPPMHPRSTPQKPPAAPHADQAPHGMIGLRAAAHINLQRSSGGNPTVQSNNTAFPQ